MVNLRVPSFVVAGALVIAACGGGDTDTTGDAPSEETASEPAATSGDGDVGGGEGSEGSEPSGESDITSTVADGWTATNLGFGIKPVLALDSSGQAGVAWVHEALEDGFVNYASAANDWAVEQIASGYFYGPIGLDFDASGTPNIAYHDHQAQEFDPALGDIVHAVPAGDGWTLTTVDDDGHDGWDTTLHISADDTVFAAGIDPAQFQAVDGVEVYELGAEGWQVTAIGSGPVDYEWNVALATNSGNQPAVTWHNKDLASLNFAERVDGEWVAETITSDGDVGRFSSLAFDADDNPHITYIELTGPERGPTTATVHYTTRGADGSWSDEVIADLGAVNLDFFGARRVTDVTIGDDGQPVVAYSDESFIAVADRSADGSWSSETIVQAGERPLGQLVSFDLDSDGNRHLAFHEVTQPNPLTGEVIYVTSR